jgi:hypothetical protein
MGVQKLSTSSYENSAKTYNYTQKHTIILKKYFTIKFVARIYMLLDYNLCMWRAKFRTCMI